MKGPDPHRALGAHMKTTRYEVWNLAANIRGVLHRPMSAEDIARLTGQRPEMVGGTLCLMEGRGEVCRVDGGMWTLATNRN